MATSKKEVAVQESNLPAAFGGTEVPEWAKNGTGRGSENVGSKDIVLPRLEIVQAQSPIKDENDAAVEGALFNTVTQEVLGNLVYVVPVFYRMEYLVWKDQDAGGGFFGAYDFEDQAQKRKDDAVKNGEDPELLQIVDTPVHYCLMVDPNTLKTEQIVMSMPKSKSKVSRKWNATIQLAGGDRFSRIYKVTTFKDKNKQNKTFFNYVVQPAGFPPEAVYREAEKLYIMFKSGEIRANHEVGGANDGESGEPNGEGFDNIGG